MLIMYSHFDKLELEPFHNGDDNEGREPSYIDWSLYRHGGVSLHSTPLMHYDDYFGMV